MTWDRHATDGYTYIPQPFLVSLPGLDVYDNWTYRVNATPKYDAVPDKPDQPKTVDLKVQKVWEDNGATANRPSGVTVQLGRCGV